MCIIIMISSFMEQDIFLQNTHILMEGSIVQLISITSHNIL